jgi:hypothetical protein
MYILVLVESSKEQKIIGSSLPRTSRHDDTFVEVIIKGRQIRGYRKGSERPHLIICQYEIKNARDLAWHNECVLRVGGPNTVFLTEGVKTNTNFIHLLGGKR